MKQRVEKDWSKEESRQISVYKTDKGLLELWDNLKPASNLFPAHIHAMGEKAEEGERSLIRLKLLDYSNGTGENTISVYANISPEETKYIYSALFCHLLDFSFLQDKIFGEPDKEGYSIVTKLQIARYHVDNQGRIRNYPWYVEIQNGRGIAARNANGGTYCQKDSYICEKKAKLFLNDRDMFILFCKANSYILAFELEYAFRQNRVGNFAHLYRLLQTEMQRLLEMQQEILMLLEGEDSLPKAS